MKQLIIATVLTIANLVYASDIPQHVATTPTYRDDRPDWWTKRNFEVNEIAKKGDIDLVFLGDSITHAWEGKLWAWDGELWIWDQYYKHRKPLNLGFSGDRTEDVLWRIQNGNFDGISPKLVILMIGTNNTGHRMDNPEWIADGIKAIIEKIHEKTPNTKILLLGIFPRGATPEEPERINNNNVNKIIKNYPKQYRFVHYMDIGEHFLDRDGRLSKEIMPDLLHLSAKGYQIWAESIEEKVKELLGE